YLPSLWVGGGQRLQHLNILDVGLGQPRTPVEREPLPLVIGYRSVIEGQVLSVKREAPSVRAG
ncbi:hypothetical protein B6U96_14095, partial [Archaeoglobales archaeon ex4484_92]